MTGTLNPGATTLVYSFTGTPGQKLFVDNLTTVGNPVNLRLIDPYNNQVFNVGSNSDSGLFNIANGGTYYLLVNGEASSSVDLRIPADRHVDRPALVRDQDHRHGDHGRPERHLRVHRHGRRTHLLRGAERFQRLRRRLLVSLRPGEPVHHEQQHRRGPDGDSAQQRHLHDGCYNNTSDSTATYSFEAFQNADPTSGLTLGTPVSATIANPGDEATYTFTITPAQIAAGQRIFYNGLDAYIGNLNAMLTDPYRQHDLQQQRPVQRGPVLTDLRRHLYADGLQQRHQPGHGQLRLRRGRRDVADVEHRADLGAGTTVSGTLASGLAANFYQISGTAGERLYYQSQSESPTYSSYVTLVNLSNGAITSYYEDYDQTWTLPATGTYLLYVSGTNASNASVNYKFEVFENVEPTSSIGLGQTVSGTIANPGDEATYTFTITPAQIAAGQRIFYNGLDAYIGSLNAMLTDPNGNTIFNNNAQYNEGPYSLTYAGTYTLTVYSSGTSRATGKYSFIVDDVTSPAVEHRADLGRRHDRQRHAGQRPGCELLPDQRHGRRAALLPEPERVTDLLLLRHPRQPLQWCHHFLL